jgi:membrane fusion protein
VSELFRREAIATSRQSPFGTVLLAQPVSVTWLATFVVGMVVAFVIFASLGTYARKETVRGYLSPDAGVARVHAPRSGVVATVHVVETEFVRAGAPLVTLTGETVTGGGVNSDEQLLAVTESQLAGLQSRLVLERARRQAEQQRLEADVQGLERELGLIGEQAATQQRLLRNLAADYERLGPVVHRGFVSQADFLKREEALLAARQFLGTLQQKSAATSTRLRQSRIALERIPLESDERTSVLQAQHLELEARRIELAAKRSVTVTAPVAGRIAALRAVPGSTVDPILPLLTLLPEGGTLEARLFVPTRAIGFVEVGQQVRLLYEAFDYRRFGVQHGTVTAISPFVLAPHEVQGLVSVTEPTYRVIVALADESIFALGRDLVLQPGMLLMADIVLERRSLLSWLLEPLFSIRART